MAKIPKGGQQLPDVHEEDRHIDPVSFSDDTEPDEEDPKEAGEVIENEDGSADVVFPEEKDDEAVETEFQDNLADKFEEHELTLLGSELCECVAIDKQARDKRDQQYADGLRRTGLGDDAPGGAQFEGASKVVHPMLAESCVDFASRAIKELFPPDGPVKTKLAGKESEDRIALADKKCKFLNWQTTKQMSEYRTELEQLLTQLPLGGSQYQKFWHDERFKRPRTEFVPIDHIFLPYAATDFYTAQRQTHRQLITKFEYEQRVTDGLYRDVDLMAPAGAPDLTAAEAANEKIEGKEEDPYNEDGLRELFEIYTWREFKQDTFSGGEMAPYIVTVDSYTEKIVSIYRNWDEEDDRMLKLDWLVEWKFIPWRGAYAVGFPHLIGGLSIAATGALRALMDSAHINNAAAMVKIKGGRTSGQNISVDPTQITEIEGPAGTDDIRKLMMAMPYNPPSPVLFQLLGWLTDASKGVIATAEDALANVGDRTPVGTTMAMIEQGSQTYSSIHARLHFSQAKALEILCRINKDFLDEEQEIKDLGDLIIRREDFATSNDIVPISDPNIFSEAQRYAQIQGVQQLMTMMPELQWNKQSIARRILNRMRLDNIDDILPEPQRPQNLNPVAENVAALHGQPLLALPKQNHMAHIFAHLEFATNPVFMNPIMGAKMLPQIVEHVTQHIGFYYADLMESAVQYEQVQGQPTRQVEERMAHANTQILAMFNEKLKVPMQLLQQAAQAAAQFAPKPPVDPAVAATERIGLAEVERKKLNDTNEFQLKQKEIEQIKPQGELMQAMIDLLKNQRDNQQHQQTELLKNQGDNQTAQFIAALKEHMTGLASEMQGKLDALEMMIGHKQAVDLKNLEVSADTALQQGGTSAQPPQNNGATDQPTA